MQVDNPFRFAGAYGVTTDDSGFNLMGARNYDHTAGRFTSRDPINVAGGANVYSYAGNDPISYIDPSGLKTFQVGAAASGFAFR